MSNFFFIFSNFTFYKRTMLKLFFIYILFIFFIYIIFIFYIFLSLLNLYEKIISMKKIVRKKIYIDILCI